MSNETAVKVLRDAANLIESIGEVAVGSFATFRDDGSSAVRCYCALGAIGQVWVDLPEFIEPTLATEEWEVQPYQDYRDDVDAMLMTMARVIARHGWVDEVNGPRWEIDEDNPGHVVTGYNDSHTAAEVVRMMREAAEELEAQA